MNPQEHLLQTRRVFLWGEIAQFNCKRAIEQIRYLSDLSLKPIYLYIHSGGGSTYPAFALIDEINGAITRGIDVYTIVQGEACSAAADILAMGKRGCRYATANSVIMLHPSSFEIQHDYSGQQERVVAFYRKCEDSTNKMIAKACGKQIKKFLSDIDKGLWLTAKEAVKYGVIDGIWDYRWEAEIFSSTEE